MLKPLRPAVVRFLNVGLIAFALACESYAQVDAERDPLDSLRAHLKVASPPEVLAARQDVLASLARLRAELSKQAVGVVLEQELQLARLATELDRQNLVPETLTEFEQLLRRILPGSLQSLVNDLRVKVARLTQMVSLTPQKLDAVGQAITTLGYHLQDRQRRSTYDGDSEMRAAFSTLARLHPQTADMAELRRRLSIANYASLIKSDFLFDVSRRSFELPINFRECRDNTSIVGTGSFRIDLSLELPASLGENVLRVLAHGHGQIQASADRERVHVTACALPRIQGAQTLRIRPSEIVGDTPQIHAQMSTQLTGVQMGGVLGRIRLVEKIVSRAIQNRLTSNDSVVADQIERTTRQRVEEEGYALAQRINGLLQHSVWDRVVALDFEPETKLWNDAHGVHSDTLYARRSQLGALTPPPPIGADDYRRLDLVTWIHQSAVNNVFNSLAGIRLDEATVRGLWQVQFKLTSDDWNKWSPARIPAVITLTDRAPLSLRFVPRGIEVVLQASACEVNGRVQDSGLRILRVRYVVENDVDGVRFVRRSIECASGTPADKVAMWQETLGLFFGETIRPQPKFRNSSFSPFLELGYLNVGDGWLVVGASRTAPSSGLQASAQTEVFR